MNVPGGKQQCLCARLHLGQARPHLWTQLGKFCILYFNLYLYLYLCDVSCQNYIIHNSYTFCTDDLPFNATRCDCQEQNNQCLQEGLIFSSKLEYCQNIPAVLSEFFVEIFSKASFKENISGQGSWSVKQLGADQDQRSPGGR